MNTGQRWLSVKALPPIVVALVLSAGCAAQTSARPTCAPVPDEFWLAGQTVYRDCGVDREVRLSGTLPRLNYTPSAGQRCVRAVIDVVVDTAGRPVRETARVVRATDAVFAAAALKDGRPVPQLVRVPFMMTVVAVPAGTPPWSVRPPRGRPPC